MQTSKAPTFGVFAFQSAAVGNVEHHDRGLKRAINFLTESENVLDLLSEIIEVAPRSLSVRVPSASTVQREARYQLQQEVLQQLSKFEPERKNRIPLQTI